MPKAVKESVGERGIHRQEKEQQKEAHNAAPATDDRAPRNRLRHDCLRNSRTGATVARELRFAYLRIAKVLALQRAIEIFF
jgi:hypothetical protein